MFWIEVSAAIWKHQPGHVTIPKETPDGRPIVVIICVRDPRSVAVAHQKNADSASWVRPSGGRTRKWNTQGMAAEEGELQHKSPNGPCQPARAAAAGCEGLAPSQPTSRPTETDVSQITPNTHLPS